VAAKQKRNRVSLTIQAIYLFCHFVLEKELISKLQWINTKYTLIQNRTQFRNRTCFGTTLFSEVNTSEFLDRSVSPTPLFAEEGQFPRTRDVVQNSTPMHGAAVLMASCVVRLSRGPRRVTRAAQRLSYRTGSDEK
jgi:hypothetical protein